MVVSIISEAMIQTARQLNQRDALLAQSDDKENYPNDDQFWEDTKGVEGQKGAAGQPKQEGGSFYSHGPCPRNRRILADVALCAGWDKKKAKVFEARIVKAAAKNYLACEKPGLTKQWDLSDPDNPVKSGKPFTFQHIAWDRLRHFIDKTIQDMDPTKRAAVKA